MNIVYAVEKSAFINQGTNKANCDNNHFPVTQRRDTERELRLDAAGYYQQPVDLQHSHEKPLNCAPHSDNLTNVYLFRFVSARSSLILSELLYLHQASTSIVQRNHSTSSPLPSHVRFISDSHLYPISLLSIMSRITQLPSSLPTAVSVPEVKKPQHEAHTKLTAHLHQYQNSEGVQCHLNIVRSLCSRYNDLCELKN